MATEASTVEPGPFLNPAATQLVTQGLLGSAVLLLMWVIWYLWKDTKGERERCNSTVLQLQQQVIKLGEDIARSNFDVAKALEERNRLTAEISATNAKLGAAVEHLASILELQHDRVLDALREIKAK